MITFGQVIAYVINIAFANVDQGWRYMFGLAGIPALFQLVVMPFLPESPRHLVISGKKDQARKVIRKIYGDSVSDAFIDNEIKLIADDIDISHAGQFKDFKLAEHYKPLIIGKLKKNKEKKKEGGGKGKGIIIHIIIDSYF